MEYYRNPNAATPGLIVRDVGLLLLRIGAGLTLGLSHAWQHLILGWNHIWKKEAWSLVDLLQEWGLPAPMVLASIASVIFALCSLGLVLGVLTRLSALLLLVCAVTGLAFTLFSPSAEMLWLYATIYAVLFICGPGCFSIDFLLNRRKKP